MSAPETSPIANDADGAHSLHRLVQRLRSHISGMAPHQKERVAGKMLIEATDEIGRLHAAIVQTLNENNHLADGENCTLIRLKRAVSPNADVSDRADNQGL
jgi:hypothetical protein